MNKEKERIETWINKYFEGMTSLEEEDMLRTYFQGNDIPPSLEVYRPMFRFFSREREKVNRSSAPGKEAAMLAIQTGRNPRRLIVRWFSIGAAACFLLSLGIKFAFHSRPDLEPVSQVFINGKKYTDIELIQAEALKTLEGLSEGNEAIYSSQIEALDIFLQ
ncbi:MAG: hypothetical protein LBN71_09155 [Tannerella sp.]|jgi:hypothetical protein|nr:hypothetical protein [Tannerella sp.]